MIRLCFLAQGVIVLVVGILLVFVDRFVLSMEAETTIGPPTVEAMWTTVDADQRYVYDPPDWVAYAAISLGAVTSLYAFALPRSKSHSHHHHHHEKKDDED